MSTAGARSKHSGSTPSVTSDQSNRVTTEGRTRPELPSLASGTSATTPGRSGRQGRVTCRPTARGVDDGAGEVSSSLVLPRSSSSAVSFKHVPKQAASSCDLVVSHTSVWQAGSPCRMHCLAVLASGHCNLGYTHTHRKHTHICLEGHALTCTVLCLSSCVGQGIGQAVRAAPQGSLLGRGMAHPLWRVAHNPLRAMRESQARSVILVIPLITPERVCKHWSTSRAHQSTPEWRLGAQTCRLLLPCGGSETARGSPRPPVRCASSPPPSLRE